MNRVFVVNEPRLMCCGQRRGHCACKAEPNDWAQIAANLEALARQRRGQAPGLLPYEQLEDVLLPPGASTTNAADADAPLLPPRMPW